MSEQTEPKWLDLAYMQKILNSHLEDRVDKIKSFSIIPATVKGENYFSEMHLATVDYTTQTAPTTTESLSMVLKSRLNNEIMAKIEKEYNVFEREAQVYTVIMDAMHQLLKSIGDKTVFGPKAIYVDERVIAQENLKVRGYAIEDVKRGLSYQQCIMVVEKLAKFHAASMVSYRKSPDMFRHHLPGNVSEHPTPIHDMYKNAIKACVDYCRTQPSLQRYITKLESFGEKIIPKMINVFSRNQTDRFHVLNHGDIWVNNLMFRKNDDGGSEDVLFVDYQEGFYGSPGIDWNYFIFSSWQNVVFQQKLDDLLTLYHETLSGVLNKLNYDQRIPTLKDVKKEIFNKGFHGLTTATCLVPILINEHQELADPINFLFETKEAVQNRNKVFDNPNFGEKLELFLPYFVENGII